MIERCGGRLAAVKIGADKGDDATDFGNGLSFMNARSQYQAPLAHYPFENDQTLNHREFAEGGSPKVFEERQGCAFAKALTSTMRGVHFVLYRRSCTVLRQIVRSSFRLAGLDVFRAAKEEFRWSHTADDFYPVKPQPRWGENSKIYRGLIKCLEPNRSEYELFVSELERSSSLLHSIPFSADGDNALKPCWNNIWFTALDAAALMILITRRRPSRFIEIGSGYSTKFASHAIKQAGLGTEIISIDPHPRDEIDRLCKRVIRSSLEECDLSVFDQLESGDMLFFDGSHRLFSNSDVLVFFLEVLPNLKPGILVQVHDIFLPFDYPEAWNRRLYNEQYLLAGMMLHGMERFRVIAPISYICYDAEFRGRVERAFLSPTGGSDIPFFYPNPAQNAGTSFWFKTS